MHKMKSALIIIDMINDFNFEYGRSLSTQAKIIAENIAYLKKELTEKDCPTIYVNDHYQLWQADFNNIIEYCYNEKSKDIIDLLRPTDDDYFLIKPKHSIFYGTALTILLSNLSVDTLYLTGLAGNICVLFSANDAYMREYNLIVPSDCIASNVKEDNEFALKMMQNVLKASIRPIRDSFN
ncbi:isochorismatase family cysteine hydrolase [Priestia koreensis]|uniref:isochorismatase family cysteine hydrolase n=1 Tax=Priestia koreensis TaxID=284581 RepID=UPI0028F6D8FE|nr:isochorismatase family cysteine hydrolase [Priestia koreensis]